MMILPGTNVGKIIVNAANETFSCPKSLVSVCYGAIESGPKPQKLTEQPNHMLCIPEVISIPPSKAKSNKTILTSVLYLIAYDI